MSWIAVGLSAAAGAGAMAKWGVGKKGVRPNVPQFEVPKWAQGLPPEILSLIRGGVGQQLQEPGEFGLASQTLQGLLGFQPQTISAPGEFDVVSQKLQELLGYQPDQFELPIQDIQDALKAQQAIQMQDWQKQINPMLARQGQLDSSYATNLMGDFLRGQQSQSLGQRADLLTQQALQNLQTQRWLPGFQSGVAGQLAGLGGQQAGISQFNAQMLNAIPGFQAGIAQQLAGLGGQRAGIGQYNLELPFKTTIPAFQQQYTTGLNEGKQKQKSRMSAFQTEMDVYKRNRALREQKRAQWGNLAGSMAMGGVGGFAGAYPGISKGVGGVGPGMMQGLFGNSPGTAQRFQWQR